MIKQLELLKSVRKFDAEHFYPGAPSEELRKAAENHVNALLERLIKIPSEAFGKQIVLAEFKLTLDAFDQSDTEERERLCGYLEQIMDIVGIESSDGLLNTWLYGFDPNSSTIETEAPPSPQIEQTWSEMEMQVYEFIESQLSSAESRQEALLDLPRELQIFYLSLIVEAEVMNGGLNQFLGNLADYAPMTAPALRELSCESAALLLEQAMEKRAAGEYAMPELDLLFRSEARHFSGLRMDMLGRRRTQLPG